MKRFLPLLIALTLLAAPALARDKALAAPLTPADRADIARIEAYLQTLDGVVARFIQVADGGGTADGTLYMQRPGRLRFAYDAPATQFLVSDGSVLTWVDTLARETTAVPLDATPLAVLVAAKPSLSGDVTVVSFERGAGTLRVGLRKTEEPDRGLLTLVFTDRPLALSQWTILDAQRRQTRIGLSDVRLGQRIDRELFKFEDQRPRKD